MQFGIFDHIDDSGIARAKQLEQRLQLVAQYDRDGFHAYHVAEHHGTPLGIVGSPNLFLAAVAQRTERLHFGALVNVLPLQHPLRLVEEWCLLDHLSGGRLEPVTARPLQQPHPPFWFGASRPDRAGWCAERAINVMSLVSAPRTRETTEGFRARWHELGRPQSALPHLGVNRHIVLADTELEAMRVAERVYPRFKESIDYLWVRRGFPRPPVYPETITELIDLGSAYVGTTEGARQYIAEQIDVAAINYMTMDVAFGGITFEEASRTASLFAREVMPAFAPSGGEVAQ